MKKVLFCLLLAYATESRAQGGSRYIIRFTDKAATPYSLSHPEAYLSPRALARRSRYGIATDSTDLPLPLRYLDSLRLSGDVTILNVSKWLNQVSIQTRDAGALAKINGFPFVKALAAVAAKQVGGQSGIQAAVAETELPTGQPVFSPPENFFDYGLSFEQIHLHHGEFLHNIGLRGQNMVIGMLDAGFYRYTTLRAFDSVNAGGQVLGIADFVAHDNSVTEDNAHGMQCFSTLSANIPGQFIGSAPGASFYLFRTEDAASEYPIEEHNWVCAAERVDSAGGDVISSSLGYNTFDDPAMNHTYAELDGQTTMAARGAGLAVKKGLLVINAAGNDGDKAWGKIVTPADVDNVLTVGAVSATGAAAAFTSRGPSADGRVKPDVASMGVGTVIQTTANTVGRSNGTSYATPNLAGLATCLWQGFPEFKNTQLIRALQQAGNRFETPNDTTGYGIPDMRKAVLRLLQEFSSAAVSVGIADVTLQWTSKDAAGMQYEIERKAPGETTFQSIGRLPAASALFATRQYRFVDNTLNLPAGRYTYRIRQIVDTTLGDVASAYIATVTATAGGSGESLTLSPNPATDKLTVRLYTTEAFPELLLQVVDSRGRVVLAQKAARLPGIQTFELAVRHLAAGQYYVTVEAAGKRLGVKGFIQL